jgi:hypothetical protein
LLKAKITCGRPSAVFITGERFAGSIPTFTSTVNAAYSAAGAGTSRALERRGVFGWPARHSMVKKDMK